MNNKCEICGSKSKVNDIVLFYDGKYKEMSVCEECQKRFAEKQTAEWEIENNGGTTMWYECSKCGKAGDIWDKFCKHCGARMKKETDGESK